MGKRKFTDEMLAEIKRDYATSSNLELAERLGITVRALEAIVIRMGVYKNKVWTQDKVEKLKSSYKTIPTSELALQLGVSIISIRQKAYKLGIAETRKSIPLSLAEAEIEKINKLFETHTIKEISEISGLTYNQIKNIVRKEEHKFIKEKRIKYAIKNNNIDNATYSDKKIANYLVGGRQSFRNPEAKKFLDYPQLIELKRNQLLLNREIKKANNG